MSVVVLSVLVVSLVGATRADATITNLIATNESGEPLDEGITTVTDADSLWAYVTSPSGGFIRVVPAGCTDCSGGGGWAKAPVPPFFAGPMPVKAAPLRPGLWKLVGIGPGGNVEIESQTFRVEVCEGCDPASAPDPTPAKQAMRGIADSVTTICSLAKGLEMMKKAQDLKQTYDMVVIDPSGVNIGMIVVKAAYDETKSAVLEKIGAPSAVPYLPGAVGLALWALCNELPDGLTEWLNDPPQPYESVDPPAFLDFSRLDTTVLADPSASLRAVMPLDRLSGFLVAGTTAWERFQAAVTAGGAAAPFQHAQALAVANDFTGVRASVESAAAELDKVAADLSADGTFPDSMPQAEIDAVTPISQRIQDTGFTASEISSFQALGLTNGEIAQLRKQLGSVDSAPTTASSFLSDLSHLSVALRNGSDALDDFATEAAVYAGRSNQPPAASFTATPASGAPPLDVNFSDTSASADLDPITSVTWDFGDGTTAEGSSVSHRYTIAGTFTVTETVSDYLDSAIATKQITVSSGGGSNRAPVAADDTLTATQNTPKTVNVLANDFDPDGDTLAVSGSTDGAHGSVFCSSAGACTYTPVAGYTGPDSFTYTVSDGQGGSATATVSVTVANNQPPVATDDEFTTKRNTAKVVFVLGNDSDPDFNPLEIVGNTNPLHGDVTCGASGVCTYTPNTDYLGPDSFEYTVSDGTATDTAHVAFTVVVNSPPVAVDDALSTVTGVEGTVFVLVNDTDQDLDGLSLADNTNGAHGSVACNSAGGCTYTPAAGFTGDDSFAYTVSDGEASDSGTVHVTVAPPCVPAICIDNGTILLAVRPEGNLNSTDGTGSAAGPGDVGLEFLPTGNDSTSPGCLCEGWGAADAESGITGYADVATDGVVNIDVVSFTHTQSTAVSVVDIGNTLRVTQDYHPSTDTPNLYEVTVTIQNISGHALGDIRYRRVMDWDIQPTAFDEFVTINTGNASQLLFDSDNGFESANPLGNRSSFGNTGDFVDAGPADHGALFDFGFGALPAGENKTFNIFYGAAANEAEAVTAVNAVGAEVFSFGQPNTPDGPTLGTPNTFVFAFGSVGGAPIFSPDAVDDTLVTPMNTPGTVNVLANDTDPNNDPLTVTSLTPSAAHGTVACSAAGLCTYTPASGYVGPDSFDYTISDGHGGSDTATVHATVSGVNHAPVASDGSLTTDAGVAKAVTLQASDQDGDALTYTIVSGPGHGTLTGSGASRTYTPAAGYSGPDSFTFKANDGKLDSNTATVTITVNPVNHAPVASDGSLTTDAGVAKAVTLQASDQDGDALTFTIVSGPSHGTLSGSGSSRTYTPAAGYSGPDSFTFKANDGKLDSNTATVSITVLPPPARSTSTTYTGSGSVQYSDSAALSGTLRDTSVSPSIGIAGKQLDFTLGTQTAHASPTNGIGNTSTSLVVTQKPGSASTVDTGFAGDGSYLASNDSDPFSIAKEDCTIAYAGDTLVPPVTNTTLAADLGEPDSSPGDRSNKTVVFTLVDAALSTQTFNATTNASGHASMSVPLADGVYGVSVSFAGDDYYKPCATTEDVLVTVEAATAKVTGGGWTSIGTGRTSFGFNAIPQAGGLWKGQFQLRSNSGKSKFHGNVVTTLAVSGNTATWKGTGRWNGQTGFTYDIAVVDNGPAGGKKSDTISITIRSSAGAVVFSTGGPQALKGGNITIHKN